MGSRPNAAPEASRRAQSLRGLRKPLVWCTAILAGLWIAWSLGCNITPGVYLGNLEASQIVVQRLLGPSLPVLWVPRWPWSATPSFRDVSLSLDDGACLEMDLATPAFRGLGASRPGYLPLFFRASDALALGDGLVQNRVVSLSMEASTGRIELTPDSLYIVRPGAPVSDGSFITQHMTITFGIDQETFVLYLEVHDQEADVELTEIVLPPEAHPLTVRRLGSPDTELSLPLRLEAGSTQIITNISGGIQDGSILLMPLLRVRLDEREEYYCPFAAWFYFSDARLRTIYDIGK